jgi:RNA polymerase sigma-70 factor (ECF subfamily)
MENEVERNVAAQTADFINMDTTMVAVDSALLDERTRSLCEVSDYRAAATLLLTELGPDVLRVTFSRLRDETGAAEVFSEFAENVWKGLPSFEFRCSVRAWAFAVARNATHRYLARDERRRRASVPLSQLPELAVRVEAVRASTLDHLRTTRRDRVSELRSQLGEEDQLILTLHIDQRMSFPEIAYVTLGDTSAPEARVRTETDRVRKRFQLIKARLRKWLMEERAGR